MGNAHDIGPIRRQLLTRRDEFFAGLDYLTLSNKLILHQLAENDPSFSPHFIFKGSLVDPRLRASNEGSPRPRVARAKEIRVSTRLGVLRLRADVAGEAGTQRDSAGKESGN